MFLRVKSFNRSSFPLICFPLNSEITHIVYGYVRIADLKIIAISPDTLLCIVHSRIRKIGAQEWTSYFTIMLPTETFKLSSTP